MRLLAFTPWTLCLCVSIVCGCKNLPIEIGDVEKVRFMGIKNNSISVEVSIPISNPNIYGFRITSIDIDVYSDNEIVGKINEIAKIKIPAKSAVSPTILFSYEFSDLLSGGLTLLKIYASKQMNLSLKGSITAKAFVASKTIYINESFSLKLSDRTKKE